MKKTVTLNPSESEIVTFEWVPSEARIYQVLVDGLTGSFMAIEAPPVYLAPCVYCGATFSTEAELIAHMNANHPGMPYLIYAYVQEDEVPSGSYYNVSYKAYISGLRTAPTGSYWLLHFTQNVYRSLVPWAYSARISVSSGAGFIEGSGMARAMYNPAPYKVYDVPPGIYALVSSLVAATSPGYILDQYWREADSGQTLIVV